MPARHTPALKRPLRLARLLVWIVTIALLSGACTGSANDAPAPTPTPLPTAKPVFIPTSAPQPTPDADLDADDADASDGDADADGATTGSDEDAAVEPTATFPPIPTAEPTVEPTPAPTPTAERIVVPTPPPAPARPTSPPAPTATPRPACPNGKVLTSAGCACPAGTTERSSDGQCVRLCSQAELTITNGCVCTGEYFDNGGQCVKRCSANEVPDGVGGCKPASAETPAPVN